MDVFFTYFNDQINNVISDVSAGLAGSILVALIIVGFVLVSAVLSSINFSRSGGSDDS